MINLQTYLDLTSMMVLATKDEQGNPYTSNVYFICDQKWKFYFRSKAYREHCKHIVENKTIAWSILNTQKFAKEAPDKKWLQFLGTARVLQGNEIVHIDSTLYGNNSTAQQLEAAGQYIVECTPTQVKIWNEELYWVEWKIEIY